MYCGFFAWLMENKNRKKNSPHKDYKILRTEQIVSITPFSNQRKKKVLTFNGCLQTQRLLEMLITNCKSTSKSTRNERHIVRHLSTCFRDPFEAI